MKIVIAPDSYKGSLSAIEVAQIMKEAISTEIPFAEIILSPMADGGEGTLESLIIATKGKYESIHVTGPLGGKIQSRFGVFGDNNTAVIEMANISGLPMVPVTHRNPMNTTSYGIGEAILTAINHGFKRIILGIGGSATNDGGLGMLQALGATFLDKFGNTVPSSGSGLKEIVTINLNTIDQRVRSCNLIVACDVDNPLCGPQGASHVFGPQKGGSLKQIQELDSSLKRYADLIEASLDAKYQDAPGAGAAGGLGFALLIIGAKLESGAEIVSSTTGLSEKLKDADWIFTGEGKSDFQTLYGKVPAYIANIAKASGSRTILISGSLGKGSERLDELFTSCHSILPSPLSLEEAMKQANKNLFNSTRNIAKLLKNIS